MDSPSVGFVTGSVPSSESQSRLNQELRAYAERMPVTIVQPTLEEANLAIEPHFPKLASQATEVQALLDTVGLVVITDISRNYKPKRISWAIALSKAEAQRQLQQYSQPEYESVRDALKIDYHWVFLVPSGDLGIATSEALMEGMGDFKYDGMPSCWILERFS